MCGDEISPHTCPSPIHQADTLKSDFQKFKSVNALQKNG
nr:MAG TPA_asm: hypothetical protein [Caudoviricetes sp.]